jgi:hypothetical protein
MEDNIKIDIKELGCDPENCIKLDQHMGWFLQTLVFHER